MWLTNGVTISGQSAAQNDELRYSLVVPPGATNLVFTTNGAAGEDADLTIKLGDELICESAGATAAETCTIPNPAPGTYLAIVLAYSALTNQSITGSYTAGGGGGGGTQTYSNTNDYTISDNTTVDSPITVSGRSGNAPSTASVTVAIVHTYQGDLKVDLVAPDGSLYNIHNRTGSGTDNINKTMTLNLSSELLNGTWKLRVNDNGAGDVGRIDSWSITM